MKALPKVGPGKLLSLLTGSGCVGRSTGMGRRRGAVARLCLVVLIVAPALVLLPAPVSAQDPTPVSVALAGWGWCLSYSEIADVGLYLEGDMKVRDGAPSIAELHLTGTLQFSMTDRTDTFEVDLVGAKIRSLFFLRQAESGPDPIIVEIEGTWFGETNYVACEGRVAVRKPADESGIEVAKPYIFLLGTPGAEVPERAPGGWVGNIEFIVAKGVQCLDILGNRLWHGGEAIRDLAGSVLTRMAVLFRELRGLGTPYFS
jgi:hypothetical protein